MKYFFAICMALLLFNHDSVFAQEKNTTHKVAKGETINEIAQKYKVTPFDIYQLNPDAQSGLKPNSILLIPKKGGSEKVSTAPKPNEKTITHQVLPKETLYGIEKRYGITDEVLKEANPFLENDGLQIGQTLIIPSKNGLKKVVTTPEKVVYHDVLAKETKYSIARYYGITIKELEQRNPEIVSGLPIGYRLNIKGNVPKVDKANVEYVPKEDIVKINAQPTKVVFDYQPYVVKPKETLYSLSRMFNLSQEELIALNPELFQGVTEGMILKVPSAQPVLSAIKKEYVALTNNSSSRKKLVLLLPFNLAKIEGDSVNSINMRFKNDKFLNMTLDFYAGALMAIDSAKQIGLSLDVNIYDSQESKDYSNIASLIKRNNLEDSDAIIGPFYQNNVEKTAQLLQKYQVPVISPLSKDIGVLYDNLYQTIPTTTEVKNTMFNYMRAKYGNIIAVVDKKKGSVIQFIEENHKDVKFAKLNANGSVSAENLKRLFVKGKMNYVVMETENTSMIKTTIATMLSAMSMYPVQLVILEPNETLDTDEINFVNLTKLKLMYPSVTRENESPEALIFEKEYKNRNKVAPSAFAIRGFDVTFDTMLRLSQDRTYQETVAFTATEQIDNKFEFYKKEDGGYTNKGVYILYYDTDLTIKEAN
ncbi:LysM peptidoglycan-binding domain-containing protein [Flavobacterium sp. W20_MBD1_R3]|uniref:LysM peptidoglycan-binding domain-containing protein n=1 Tax=Flavobacterium sp. W20_MBD1_R3 TaxID=3240278 RepID=UPI003F90BD09